MLSCKKASALIDKKIEIKLSWKENMQLTMHKSMCDACTAYEKQSKKIDELLHGHFHGADIDKPAMLSNEALKEKIINNIK